MICITIYYFFSVTDFAPNYHVTASWNGKCFISMYLNSLLWLGERKKVYRVSYHKFKLHFVLFSKRENIYLFHNHKDSHLISYVRCWLGKWRHRKPPYSLILIPLWLTPSSSFSRNALMIINLLVCPIHSENLCSENEFWLVLHDPYYNIWESKEWRRKIKND